MPVDDVDDRLPVDDQNADQNPLGVCLDVLDHVGLDLFPYLVGDPLHETESREVGEHEVGAGPVVVVRAAGDAGALAGVEGVARQLPHQRRFTDVGPAGEDDLALPVRACIEHTADTAATGKSASVSVPAFAGAWGAVAARSTRVFVDGPHSGRRAPRTDFGAARET